MTPEGRSMRPNERQVSQVSPRNQTPRPEISRWECEKRVIEAEQFKAMVEPPPPGN